MPRSDGRPTAQEKRDAAIAAKADTAKQVEKNGGATDAQLLNHQAIIRPDAVKDAHGEIAKPQSAGAKVIVALKLGIAYFDIQLCSIVDKFEQNMQGGRTVKEATRIGQVVRLRGTAYPRGTPPEGFPDRPEIIAGAALNYGIDKDWFTEWMHQNRLNPIVVNKMIFGHETIAGVHAMAKELAGQLSGLDPVNPKNLKGDPRMPRTTRQDVSDVETEDSRTAKARSAA